MVGTPRAYLSPLEAFHGSRPSNLHNPLTNNILGASITRYTICCVSFKSLDLRDLGVCTLMVVMVRRCQGEGGIP
jgi:hypothetical protein